MNDQGKLHQKMTFECRLAKISKAGDEVRSKDAVRVGQIVEASMWPLL